MQKTILFENTLTTKSVDKLIASIEDIKINYSDATIQFYFSSTGGENTATSILQDFLKDFTDCLILIGYDKLFSNGFDVFYKYSGEKRLLSDTFGMVHK